MIRRLIDAQVRIVGTDESQTPPDFGRILFYESFPLTDPHGGRVLAVEFILPQSVRLSLLQGRLGGALLIIPAGLPSKRLGGSGSRPPWTVVQAEMNSLGSTARATRRS